MTEERTLPAATSRFETIDVLRGLSILAVVLLHTWLRLRLAGYDIQRPSLSNMVARLFFFNGGNGVTVFFAVSGFLITLTSLRRFGSLSRMKVRTFYRIRFARIAPLLTTVVVVLSILALMHAEGFGFSAKRAPLWRAILAVFTFHSNWLEARYGFLPANWNVMWSLSVEEMFYLFFPLACAAMLRMRWGMTAFVLLLGAFIVMGPFARSLWSTNDIWREQSYLGGMDCIALGCLTALITDYLQRNTQMAAKRTLLAGMQIFGWTVLALIALGPHWIWKLLPSKPDCWGTALALATCLVMAGSVLRQSSGSNVWPNKLLAPIRWYGRHSYEVYLTHEFIVIWGVLLFLHFHPNVNPEPNGLAQPQIGLPQMLIWVAGILVLTAPLGWLVARYISEPMNRRLRGAKQPTLAK